MVKIKICGITNLDDALAAVEYGADALGFIFVHSPRQVSQETAHAIVSKLPPFVTTVGVFMDNDLAFITETMAVTGFDMIQLHGNESPQFCEKLAPKVIKAFTPASLPDLASLKKYPARSFMLDKQKGSTTLPEELWPIARSMNPYGKVVLAGALIPENVAEAIQIANPFAVDVASGVEKEPGKKDHLKLKTFIQAVKGGT